MSKAISYLYFNNIEHEDLYGTQTDSSLLPIVHNLIHSQTSWKLSLFVIFTSYILFILEITVKMFKKKKKDSKVTKGQLKIKVKMDIAHVR